MTIKNSENQHGFSLIIALEDATPEGRDARLEADEAARSLIAERLGVPSVRSLAGELHIRLIADGIAISGTLDAALVRECVVSLEPMDEIIRETIEIKFSPDAELAADAVEIDVDADAVELLPPGGIDLGEILIQQLALAMNPYPRKEGAASLVKNYASSPEAAPFSALRGLFAGKPDKG